MKKFIFSLVAFAAIAACTKSEIQYEQNTDTIGFQIVSGKMTKAAVVTNNYPENLNMYVFAMTELQNGTANTTADYLKNAEFAKVKTDGGINLWGGWDSSAEKEAPYYWPNVKNLYFAGVSKSGNINSGATPTYNNGAISVNGYVSSPGTTTLGDNDLMWFPTTDISYGKLNRNNDKVPVEMLHACSWITVKVGGDSQYTIKDIHIEGLTTKANVTLAESAEWDLFTAVDPDNPTAEETQYLNQNFSIFTDSKQLATTATAEGFEDIENNTIVIPNQIPGTLSITYTFESQAEETIEETVTGSLKFDSDTPWAPGVHYTYTVTITASKILIAPTASTWEPSPASGGHDVTVQ